MVKKTYVSSTDRHLKVVSFRCWFGTLDIVTRLIERRHSEKMIIN